LLVYLALARFGKRPVFSQLPRDLQLDVRAFFSAYKQACAKADELLFSAGNRRQIEEAVQKASVGKTTPSALYIHVSALAQLPSILRVYEGCARAYIGAVEGANLIKLYRDEPKVSYLSYPEFESDPHPSLAASLMVDLQTFRVKYREYHESPNPPILHRKETFLAPDHPLRPKFARLTEREESCGLYAQSESIGTRDGWRKVLDEYGLYFSGHRLLRKKMK
jgi:DNA phosphorothioation-associated putative methyltransferase